MLFDAGPDLSLVGASITKLFTASAALRVLGPDARFRTTVRADPPVDGVLTGDLWLVGGGDPVLGTNAWAASLPAAARVHTSLETLADRVVAAGVRRVAGRIIGDESRYDANRLVPSMPARLIADGEIGPLSALSVNDGFRVSGHPGVPFTDPPADAAAVFARLLSERGVTAGGSGAGEAFNGPAELAAVDSPPIGELVHAMLRDSDNGTAELLVKELGVRRFGSGSTSAGARAMGDTARSARVRLRGLALADGSGLGDANRVTCEALTSLLVHDSGLLATRLPVAAVDGTLRNRFKFAPGAIRGKTGSLDGVAALAGYAQAPDGGTIQFAYVVNGLANASSGRALQDQVAAAVVSATG
ncbi:MAG: D-alanyl-D-alanine carboxypeptidase/D-alanyl-D-alanine-endopeptidase [Acidimicrobiales bacterium]|nr:D-alanyl-D-alanine carboxypeptidase/D-alanyl-D-alanine-endopeptidase [Acidimicrobiales bacterium]